MARTHRRHSYRKSKRWNPRRGRGRSSYRSRGRGRRGSRGGMKSAPSVRDWQGFKRIRSLMKNPKRRYSRKGMTRAGLRRGMLLNLGSMNPRGRARGGRKFTSHRRGRKWESVVHGSLPYWANPRRRGRGRRGRR